MNQAPCGELARTDKKRLGHRFDHLNQRVLITGAASGIGRATAELFAERGAPYLALVDTQGDALSVLRGQLEGDAIKVDTVVADVADRQSCSELIELVRANAGGLDVVVSNAGTWEATPFLDITSESWDRMIAVNLTAGFFITQLAARLMVADDRPGVILFTASVGARAGSPSLAHYNASKAALVNLAASMAIELGPLGIRVNAVSPGPTDTGLAAAALKADQLSELRENFPSLPLQRLGKPSEVAEVFSFLASRSASFVTGANVLVDGGLSAWSTGAQMPWHRADR